MLYITKSAQKYFIKLLTTQKKGTQIRFSIKNPGTFYAKCKIYYYFPIQNNDSNDIEIKFDCFSIYFQKHLKPFIKDAEIDIISNELGNQLSVKAPNINKSLNNLHTKTTNNQELSLENRIKYVLEYQINPSLAIHGGSVSLMSITKDLLAVLQFHGGCNGCSMAAYTIKEGIEMTLKKLFPELKGVLDSTHHQRGKHSFY